MKLLLLLRLLHLQSVVDGHCLHGDFILHVLLRVCLSPADFLFTRWPIGGVHRSHQLVRMLTSAGEQALTAALASAKQTEGTAYKQHTQAAKRKWMLAQEQA